MQSFDYQSLRKWFYQERRPLPWRENPTPYGVWISEVMLQQTQVSVVIPYYIRWMKTFPTIEALAQAPIEQVIKTWEGLGYYSRARNLHAGAQYVLGHFDGELPKSEEALKKVKGLGPYTVGAIRSFAFKQKAAAVDGNVFRVLARYFSIKDSIDKGKTQKEIRSLCEKLLPDEEPWIIMEALIELGALICQKQAKCFVCPLQKSCLGKSQADLLPIRKKREKAIHLHRHVAVVYSGHDILLRRGEEGRVMADLAEFPYCDVSIDIQVSLDLDLELEQTLPEVTHGFTKYKAFLYPHLYCGRKKTVQGHKWFPFSQVKSIPFSSGHRRILLYLRSKKLLPI